MVVQSNSESRKRRHSGNARSDQVQCIVGYGILNGVLWLYTVLCKCSWFAHYIMQKIIVCFSTKPFFSESGHGRIKHEPWWYRSRASRAIPGMFWPLGHSVKSPIESFEAGDVNTLLNCSSFRKSCYYCNLQFTQAFHLYGGHFGEC